MLKDKVDEIRANIDAACRAVGRTNDVRILAAVKTVPPKRILELKECGVDLIGENRVSEFTEKYEALAGQFDMHFIGALQTNKINKILGKVSLIHSLDRVSLADELDAKSERQGLHTNVLIEVNIGSELTKSGVSPEEFERFAEYACAKRHLTVKGVMSVLPKDAPDELYERVRALYEKLRTFAPADVLSMGMSGDYITAVKHGANLIRIGSALFGQRKYEVTHV